MMAEESFLAHAAQRRLAAEVEGDDDPLLHQGGVHPSYREGTMAYHT